MAKIVTLGEIMLRLSPMGNDRFIQSESFRIIPGGGEANVAVSVANYGHEAYFVSKLPKHEIGQIAVNALRRYGVNTQFIAHISGMDAMARALMNAADILENSELPAMKKARYASFDSGIGKDFEDGKLTFEQVYEYGKKVEEPKQTSGKQEKYETIVALHCK